MDVIAARVRELGVADLYTGIRLTQGDPLTLVADPPGLVEALAEAVRQSISCDGAQAVIIGGGPLGRAAIALASRFTTPIIAPIPAAVRRLLRAIARRLGAGPIAFYPANGWVAIQWRAMSMRRANHTLSSPAT